MIFLNDSIHVTSVYKFAVALITVIHEYYPITKSELIGTEAVFPLRRWQ